MVKAVIFDLDGTLVNSLEDLASSTNYALKQFGFKTHKTEAYKYFVGDGIPKLIERALPKNINAQNIRLEVLDCFLKHYRVHYADKTTVYEGIRELLNDLKRKSIKLAIISNKAQEMASTVVNKLFNNEFEIVYGKQEGYPAKPDAKLTLKLISELEVEPQECLFVGDSGMDMATAKNAGCFGVGVLWGFRDKTELCKNSAKFIAEKPCEIMDLVKEFNNEI